MQKVRKSVYTRKNREIKRKRRVCLNEGENSRYVYLTILFFSVSYVSKIQNFSKKKNNVFCLKKVVCVFLQKKRRKRISIICESDARYIGCERK